jgi:hypothetical protein
LGPPRARPESNRRGVRLRRAPAGSRRGPGPPRALRPVRSSPR